MNYQIIFTSFENLILCLFKKLLINLTVLNKVVGLTRQDAFGSGQQRS